MCIGIPFSVSSSPQAIFHEHSTNTPEFTQSLCALTFMYSFKIQPAREIRRKINWDECERTLKIIQHQSFFSKCFSHPGKSLCQASSTFSEMAFHSEYALECVCVCDIRRQTKNSNRKSSLCTPQK